MSTLILTDPKHDLEKEITEGLTELRALLSECSTYSVAGSCFTYMLKSPEIGSKDRLGSPAKQIPFLLGVMLSQEEPNHPVEFDSSKWKKAHSILQRLSFSYMNLYMPSQDEVGSLAPEWHRIREVSMLAFLHFFNTGLLASFQQLSERIKIYLVPFDAELRGILGISASQAIAICQWMSDKLQKNLDDLQSVSKEERKHRHQMLERAEKENWSLDDLKKVAQKSDYSEKAMKLLAEMRNLGLVKLPELEQAFPGIAPVFWKQFSMRRGEGPEIRYPTEQSIFELKPLIRLNETEAICPVPVALISSILLVGEQSLIHSQHRDSFLRARDKSLELEALSNLKLLLGPNASIWSSVYETPDNQYEHDIIAVDEELCIVLEAKASPPIEPFRDPDKAFTRLRRAFREDTGLQKAYQQANRIVNKLKTGNAVTLYNDRGIEVGLLQPEKARFTVAICVTRDNFGPLATNLSLLLEKEASESYPWAVNILDLSGLVEAWSYFKWGSKEFRKYLEQRILLHGKVFSDDELDYAGYFIRHGSFESAIKTSADLVQLNPDYSSVFDEVYRHLHLGGPPVAIETKEPVMMDLRKSLASGKPFWVEPREQRVSERKVGRNEQCPCGSGKKYKRCCGA